MKKIIGYTNENAFVKCGKCGCVFSFNNEDVTTEEKIEIEVTYFGVERDTIRTSTVICPNCGKEIRL